MTLALVICCLLCVWLVALPLTLTLLGIRRARYADSRRPRHPRTCEARVHAARPRRALVR
jgi:hypothetical protein